MPELGIDFFLTGLTSRMQIGLYLVVSVVGIMAVLIGFTIWQERTFNRK